MKKYFLTFLVVIVGFSLTGVLSAEDEETIEEFGYVFRSKPNPTLDQKAYDFCMNVLEDPDVDWLQRIDGFGGYDWFSITSIGRDGSIVNWERTKVAEDLTCSDFIEFGPPNYQFRIYVQVNLGRRHPTTFNLKGTCELMDVEPPSEGIFPSVCIAGVDSTPVGYFGGVLTANSYFNVTGSPSPFVEGSIITIRIYQDAK